MPDGNSAESAGESLHEPAPSADTRAQQVSSLAYSDVFSFSAAVGLMLVFLSRSCVVR
jgi:hypothetical protein